jgi:2-oxoglutarate dehydrogenase E2 component (dihydrolipoamide succinyltransferase)
MDKLHVDDMTGGTLLSLMVVYLSMLSTPIINPPQSGFWMHNIIERPIAVNGKVEIHPMMYVALSYDRLLMVKSLLDSSCY